MAFEVGRCTRGFRQELITANTLRIDPADQKAGLREPVDHAIKRTSITNRGSVRLYRLMQLCVCEACIRMCHQLRKHGTYQLRTPQSARSNQRVNRVFNCCGGSHKRKAEAILIMRLSGNILSQVKRCLGPVSRSGSLRPNRVPARLSAENWKSPATQRTTGLSFGDQT